MNDTTRWIMIILLLLLIAAAVFMLLRSPGKDKDDRDAELGSDADRDGATPVREEPALGTGDRGVYDQEADRRAAAPVETAAFDETTTTPVEGRSAQADGPVHGTSTYDDTPAPADPTAAGTGDPGTDHEPGHGAELRADRSASAYEDGRLQDRGETTHEDAEPYHPEAGATEEAVRPGATAYASPQAGTDAVPATDRDDRGDRDVPGTDEDHGTHHAGAAGATGVKPLTDDQITEGGREEPLPRDQQEPFVAEDEESHGGHQTQALPVDAGTGAPETADDIVAGDRSHGGHGATAAPVAEDDGRHDVEAPPQHHVAEPTDRADGTAQGAGLAPVFAESRYGAGSADPLDDGSGPAGWKVKGNIGSMLFHTPESPSWDAVRAEVWFESEDAARAAGFAHWDRRRR